MTDSLADRIAWAHKAPDGFAEIKRVTNPWEGEPVSLTDIIRELQARLAVAEGALNAVFPLSVNWTKFHVRVNGSDSHHTRHLEALYRMDKALAACDLTKPFVEGK